jgi:hypothetical protein
MLAPHSLAVRPLTKLKESDGAPELAAVVRTRHCVVRMLLLAALAARVIVDRAGIFLSTGAAPVGTKITTLHSSVHAR